MMKMLAQIVLKMSDEQDPGSNSIDPKALYTLDEFIAEEDILDDVISEAMVVLKTSIEAL